MKFDTFLLLQVLAFVILFLEIFIPSFGVLTLLAGILMVYSWNLVAENQAQLLPLVVGVDLILTPLIAWIAFKKLKTSSLTNRAELDSSAGFHSPELHTELREGQIGKVHSDLRPVGEALFAERIYEVHTRGEWLEKGTQIQIIAIGANKITVGVYAPSKLNQENEAPAEKGE